MNYIRDKSKIDKLAGQIQELIDRDISIDFMGKRSHVSACTISQLLKGEITEITEQFYVKIKRFIGEYEYYHKPTSYDGQKILQDRLQKALPNEKVTVKNIKENSWQFTINVKGRASFVWRTGGSQYFETEQAIANEVKSIVREIIRIMQKKPAKRFELKFANDLY